MNYIASEHQHTVNEELRMVAYNYGDDKVFLILKQDREDQPRSLPGCWPQFDREEETWLLAGLKIYPRGPNNN